LWALVNGAASRQHIAAQFATDCGRRPAHQAANLIVLIDIELIIVGSYCNSGLYRCCT
jgi:hypothetical protein